MKELFVSFFTGLFFALGLGLSGMTAPQKVLAFLDVSSSRWDPSLACVMGSAVLIATMFFVWAEKRGRAWWSKVLDVPSRTQIDGRLLGGSVLFGVGWGLSGYCPGPALMSVVTLRPGVVWFVGAMLVGFWLFEQVEALLERRAIHTETSSLQ